MPGDPWSGYGGFGRARSARPAQQDPVVAAQDGLLDPAQFLTGLHAQLVEESPARLPVHGERLRLPAAAVQRAHPQRGEGLVVRPGQGHRHELVQGLRVAPEQDEALDPVLVQGAPLP